VVSVFEGDCVKFIKNGGFEGTKKNSVFWNVKTCSPVKVNRRFTGELRVQTQDLYKLAGNLQASNFTPTVSP
jgi:hypothetical protein